MDTIAQSIAATCPAQFSGISGALFSQAVTALLTAHCAYVDNLEWPKDQSKKVTKWVEEGLEYDFIVVGAGTAGSYVASQLVEQFPSKSVLLIEAGKNPLADSEVPGLMFLTSLKEMDWAYKSSPSTDNCLGFKNGSCIWSKGKAMGGSSSLNAMLYTRGNPDDYDRWGVENPGWDYETVRNNFNNIETSFKFHDVPEMEKHPFHSLMSIAYMALELKNSGDANKEAKRGIGRTKLLCKNGKRYNTAKLVLSKLKDSVNFNLMKNTIVEKVLIDPESKRATGVKVRNNGKIMEIKSRAEVILSAGSIGTPKILMLSGVGPKDHLSDVGIKTIVDLPVGHNLQDHASVGINLQVSEEHSTNLTPLIATSIVLQYMLFRAGQLSNIGLTDFMAFLNVKNENVPDIQFHHTHILKDSSNLLRTYYGNIGLNDEIAKIFIEQNKRNDLIGIYPTLLHPKSRGTVQLRNADPLSDPIIKPNYFKEKEDLNIMLGSIELIKKLTNSPSFHMFGIKWTPVNLKGCELHKMDTDGYWECYVRHLSTTVFHPVGTAKMGPSTDKAAVVSNELKVHGVTSLRVVDASIMPTIPGGNTMGPTLMIADRALAFILNQYKREATKKDEL